MVTATIAVASKTSSLKYCLVDLNVVRAHDDLLDRV